MALRPAADRLRAAFDLIDRVQHADGVRERTALSIRLDEWVRPDQLVPLPGGGQYPEAGWPLYETAGAAVWLLPGARVLHVPRAPAEEPTVEPLVDAAIDVAALGDRLRGMLLRDYLGPVDLSALGGPAVPGIVTDLLGLADRLGPDGRAVVLGALAEAMHADAGWEASAARLKAAFERGLGDRAPAVRELSAAALVQMAAGLAPLPPTTDPHRIPQVLFAVPQPDVHAAALRALGALPAERLAALATTLEPLLRSALVDPVPETRRLAGELEIRLAGGEAAATVADRLSAADPAARTAALHEVAALPDDQVDLLLPAVLDAIEDPLPDVREAALAVLEPILDREAEDIRRRILLTLLGSPDARLAASAVDYIGHHPDTAPQLVDALRAALDGPEDARAPVAAVLTDLYERMAVGRAVEGYIELLRHPDPVVRQTAMRQLASRPPDRSAVREELFHALVEHLRDPEPQLRVESGRTLVALRYPKAPDIAGQLAFDAHPMVRRGVLAVLRAADDPVAYRQAEETSRALDTLFAFAPSGTGGDRVRWTAALDALTARRHSRVPEVLVMLLADLPADTGEPFLRYAIEEIEGRLLERAGHGEDLLALCRRLVAPDLAQPEHAARLAGNAAAEDPAALDFLWTLYTQTTGAGSEAARRALAALAGASKSDAVRDALRAILRVTDDPGRRDVLRTLLGGS
jgi:hypothetical protein